MKPQRLSPQDWIQASFRALALGGAQALRVERIARDLKVSKGSFYWHFSDLPALKIAMLDHWFGQATVQVIAQIEGAGGPARERLYRLLEIATSDLAAPYGGLSTEVAIREWSRFEPYAAKILAQVDAARLGYIAALIEEAGGQNANKSARLFIYAYDGALLHGADQHAGFADDMSALLDLLLPN
ncbi:MAG: TetR/AcrR family transcriptional regulator [Rhodobacteraceae bacterium]|nr:TetR/AcrR family transcriptional regulator [Paracoccaceae bacterium]